MTKKEQLIQEVVGLVLPPQVALKPMAMEAWEKCLDNTESLLFDGYVYALICYSSPHLDYLKSYLTK